MSQTVFDPIEIRYTGLFADAHLVDALEFGRSVAGVGRVGNSLCHLLFFGEVARPKSHKVRFYVRPSKENGLLQEIVAVMNSGSMPMFAPILTVVAKNLSRRLSTQQSKRPSIGKVTQHWRLKNYMTLRLSTPNSVCRFMPVKCKIKRGCKEWSRLW